MRWTIDSLAEAIGLPKVGGAQGERVLLGVAGLDFATPSDLAFAVHKRYEEQLRATQAGCVIVAPELADLVPSVALVAEQPHLAFARAAQRLHPEPTASGVIAATAAIDATAKIAESVDIGDGASVAAGAVIGSGVHLEPGVRVGADAVIGDDSWIGANVVIDTRCRLGQRVRVQAGAVIGSEGFGYIWSGDEGWVRVPQLGRVIIGDDVQIGANTTIDRGALGDTVIENGVLLDNLIQIAHNVRIGEDTAIAGCVGIAGSAVIGRRCTMGGAAGIVGHVELADDVHITAQSRVTHSLLEAGTYSSGTPLQEHTEWRRNAARFRQLDALARRLRRLGG